MRRAGCRRTARGRKRELQEGSAWQISGWTADAYLSDAGAEVAGAITTAWAKPQAATGPSDSRVTKHLGNPRCSVHRSITQPAVGRRRFGRAVRRAKTGVAGRLRIPSATGPKTLQARLHVCGHSYPVNSEKRPWYQLARGCAPRASTVCENAGRRRSAGYQHEPPWSRSLNTS
jgi:hypothetical protein